MGNTCRSIQPCRWRPFHDSNTNMIEIVVQDTRDAMIKTVQVKGNKIKEIRFILPIIKITDENNQEYLVYHPKEMCLNDEDLSAQTRTIVIASEAHPKIKP